jgi:hypothetical protein
MSDTTQASEGNVSLDNVEVFNYEGKEVRYMVGEDGQAKVETPEGLTADQERKFNEQVPSLLASLNKKNYDAKREYGELDLKKKELELKERELALREAEIKGMRKEEAPKNDFLHYMGVSDKEELTELQLNDPVSYAERFGDWIADTKSNAQISATFAEQTLASQVAMEGYDVELVKAFQRSHHIGDFKSAFELYKGISTRPTNSSQRVRQSMQANAPEILPAGSLTKKGDPFTSIMEKFKKV